MTCNISSHKIASVLVFLFLCIISLILCAIYEFDQSCPLLASLFLFVIIAIWGCHWTNLSSMPLLVFFTLAAYCLPFLLLFEHLANPEISSQQFIWGLTANKYNMNPEIIEKLAMVGTIGLGGVVCGFYIARIIRSDSFRKPAYSNSSLTLPSFLLIAGIAFFLSWINAPRQTIFQAAYTTSESRLAGINFNGAWMLSYIFVLLLLIDSQYETLKLSRSIKMFVTLLISAVIIVWFQFMRGDRECIGLIFAVVAIFLCNIKTNKLKVSGRKVRNKIILALCLLIITFVATQYFGAIRSSSVGRKSFPGLKETRIPFKYGTWSATLLTPLSVVGDFYYGRMKPRMGSTYWDILLSIPPGVITQWLGIERPIEGTHGPAWEMRYGIGGTNVVVVPFINFKTFGVFCILMLYGCCIGALESSMRTPRKITTLLYGTFFVSILFWFWYGDMYIVRAIMGFCVVWVAYLLLPKKRLLKQGQL